MTSDWKQPSSVNPDLRLNRIKSSVKSNPDLPRFTVTNPSESNSQFDIVFICFNKFVVSSLKIMLNPLRHYRPKHTVPHVKLSTNKHQLLGCGALINTGRLDQADREVFIKLTHSTYISVNHVSSQFFLKSSDASLMKRFNAFAHSYNLNIS